MRLVEDSDFPSLIAGISSEKYSDLIAECNPLSLLISSIMKVSLW